MAGGQKSSLSKNVLQMKFMQRSVLRIEKEKNEEEKQRDIDDEHWVLDLPVTKNQESKFVYEPSLVRIQELCFGRVSYNGCNPEVEKLMVAYRKESELDAAKRREDEISVNDVEMAERYTTLIHSMKKKFATKRERSQITDNGNDNDESDESDCKVVRVEPGTSKGGNYSSSKRQHQQQNHHQQMPHRKPSQAQIMKDILYKKLKKKFKKPSD